MLIQLLKSEFQQRKERNPQYSLRAFAKSLKIHSSTLSVILSKKRKITPKQAEKILRELDVSAFEKNKILLSLLYVPVHIEENTVTSQALQDETFSITMPISSKKIPIAKKMISNFRQELAEYFEAGASRDEAYRLDIQLFPSSK